LCLPVPGELNLANNLIIGESSGIDIGVGIAIELADDVKVDLTSIHLAFRYGNLDRLTIATRHGEFPGQTGISHFQGQCAHAIGTAIAARRRPRPGTGWIGGLRHRCQQDKKCSTPENEGFDVRFEFHFIILFYWLATTESLTTG
jgi:hypothetical protein